ncbi:putative DNA topoisomerase 6 subunit A-like [Capsicum annuum]|nr:putative DNA topoisomerase 6 subunit A-like [Capsicum annuum]
MAVANWAELSKDLSDVIVKRVKLIEDFIAFSVVCTSWRNSATKANFDFLSPQLPLLMLADKGHKYSDVQLFDDKPRKICQKGTSLQLLLTVIYVYSGANFLVTVHGTAMNFCVMGSGNMFQSHGAYSSYNERGATTVVGLLQR